MTETTETTVEHFSNEGSQPEVANGVDNSNQLLDAQVVTAASETEPEAVNETEHEAGVEAAKDEADEGAREEAAGKVAAKDEATASNMAAKTRGADGVAGGIQSPSLSVSSVLSLESTKELIKSLSTHQLAEDAETPAPPQAETSTTKETQALPVPPEQTHTPPTPTTRTSPKTAAPAKMGAASPQIGSKKDKKPVRFTVRKVSRDTSDTTPNATEGREYLYGNIPENRARAQERKNSEKMSQLHHSQRKHAEYSARIDKINKEIEFLTNLLPPYNVEIDYATRTKITRAIEKLRMKQDEVEKKKYTLGITISRLWREHDESAIWVRSVSNQ